MTQKSPAHIVEAFYDALEQRDFETVLGVLREDAALWNEHERTDHSARFFFSSSNPLWSAVSELRYAERKYSVADQEVTVEYVARGRTVRGRHFAFPVTARLLLTSDGQGIRRIEEYFGLADAAAFQEMLAG
ncbi:nuclear transport factor 2 family protein [Streptomyces collinus]|uniref:nuclear transport factor 2 family protein n=1 Tax=Streptomyces collinus TaxID=42684 RepID=UPI002943B68D|nr:nuclear transport factor 2 family protein [Streptomyces collinus]